jgi:hypothetical protein
MLLNNGKNPFYNKGETREEIIKKIQEKKVEFDDINYPISEIGKDFINKLLTKKVSHRYTVNPALNHPWITMNKFEQIPKTVIDEILIKQYNNHLKELFLTSLFMYYYKMKNLKKVEEEILPVRMRSNTISIRNVKLNILDRKVNNFDIKEYSQRAKRKSFMQRQKFEKTREKMFAIPKKEMEEITESGSVIIEKIEKNINDVAIHDDEKDIHKNNINDSKAFKTINNSKRKKKANLYEAKKTRNKIINKALNNQINNQKLKIQDTKKASNNTIHINFIKGKVRENKNAKVEEKKQYCSLVSGRKNINKSVMNNYNNNDKLKLNNSAAKIIRRQKYLYSINKCNSNGDKIINKNISCQRLNKKLHDMYSDRKINNLKYKFFSNKKINNVKLSSNINRNSNNEIGNGSFANLYFINFVGIKQKNLFCNKANQILPKI